MRLIQNLELHRYAPEMNTAILRHGVRMRCPGAQTIRDVRVRQFSPQRRGVFVTFKWYYPPGSTVDTVVGIQTRKGVYTDLATAWADVKKLKSQIMENVGKPLFDGTAMPAPKFIVRAELRG